MPTRGYKFTTGNLVLNKFDPSKMRDSAIVLFLAPKNSGKTTLLLDFLWHKRHIPAAFCYSSSEEANDTYSKTIPPLYCYSKFDTDRLQRIYTHQERKLTRYKRPRTNEERKLRPDKELSDKELYERDPHIIGIVEDCLHDSKPFKETIVNDLFYNGRHRKMFMMITMQYVMSLPAKLRSNVDYVVILNEPSPVNRKKIFDCFGAAFQHFDVFNELMDQCTSDYRCLVIDNGIKSSKIADKIFWYKADLHPTFRVGCARYWEFNRLNYVKPSNDRIEEEERKRLNHTNDHHVSFDIIPTNQHQQLSIKMMESEDKAVMND